MMLIADDLTGAADCASFLAESGRGVTVHIDPPGWPDMEKDLKPGIGPIVINTNTRTMKKAEAEAEIRRLSLLKEIAGNMKVFKKLDTAYRGNPALEISILSEIFGTKYCYIINSIPSMKRTTVSGIQISGGKDIRSLDLYKNSSEEIRGTFRDAAIGSGLEDAICGITLKDIRKGRIASILERNINYGKTVFVFDSETNKDIMMILKSIPDKLCIGINNRCIWAGSLGLLGSLIDYIDDGAPMGKQEQRPVGKTIERSKGAIIGATASLHENTQKQLEKAVNSENLEVIEINIESFFKDSRDTFSPGPEREEKLDRSVTDILKNKKQDNIFLIPAKIKDPLPENVNSSIPYVLGNTIKKFIEISDGLFSGIILVGGDTSYNVLRQLAATRLEIRGMIEPGVDYGIVSDGIIKGWPIVLKGGSVGNADTLVDMINFAA